MIFDLATQFLAEISPSLVHAEHNISRTNELTVVELAFKSPPDRSFDEKDRYQDQSGAPKLKEIL
ncbi:hypothetical protein [Paenarthrobacter sp. PH39-S1]|uniref:hypothetical protein n=1 Tax=Paenarthrobacter sp. PH39-S1 TaxID=3046204 RepID=UPI0024BB28EF|nr:hypothetical protein [Paenarthrobacter sp. PH39-S1]MDJ0358399.1 hypothetical protein [Paenarthrobacter sp. PH39-S1]